MLAAVLGVAAKLPQPQVAAPARGDSPCADLTVGVRGGTSQPRLLVAK